MRKHKNYSKTRLKKTCLLGWRNRTQATQQNSELPHREDPYFSCKRKGNKENNTKNTREKRRRTSIFSGCCDEFLYDAANITETKI